MSKTMLWWGAFVLAAGLLGRFFGKWWRYRSYYLVESILTPFERSFFHKSLRPALPRGFACCPKVRLADFVGVRVREGRAGFWKLFGPIGKKHVDFLICKLPSFSPVLAVELDDGTHGRLARRRRDRFVDQVYRSIRLPVLHVRAKEAMDPGVLRQKVMECIG